MAEDSEPEGPTDQGPEAEPAIFSRAGNPKGSGSEPQESSGTGTAPPPPGSSMLPPDEANPDQTALAPGAAELAAAGDSHVDGGGKQMSFLDHLEELRWRLLKGLAAILIGAVVCLIFRDELQDFLTEPFREAATSLDSADPGVVSAIRSWIVDEDPGAAAAEEPPVVPPAPRQLQSLGVMTLFFVGLQIAIIGGAVLALPVLFYQFWQFVAPGLLAQEKRLMLPIVGLSVVCFAIGAMLAYLLVLPLGLRFFLALESSNVTSNWAIDQYIGFVLRLILGFGIVFEMPVITLFLSRLGLVTPEYLRRVRRYAIIIVFALAAIFTPPDPISQLLMALPLLALYEVSIWVSRLTNRKRAERETGG